MFKVENPVQHQTRYKIGDLVRHKKTGMTGKVIGYGYRKITDSYYLTTLKVELGVDRSIPIQPVAEDLLEKWQAKQEKRILACTLPHFPSVPHAKLAKTKSSYSKSLNNLLVA